jgi:SAM-dependent methyltransferase
VADLWTQRAELYRQSAAHREGPDLDLIVEWAAGARTALDVATGGGHVARRLREAGLRVVSCDPAPGMHPDVVCRAEDLPFADGSFDVVACRVAPHHFADVQAAVREMSRVSRSRVLIVDNLYHDERVEQAERLRDPTHVRNYTEPEWRTFLDGAGLRVDAVELTRKPIEVEPWLLRAGCEGEEAERVRALLGEHVQDGWISLARIAFKGVKR